MSNLPLTSLNDIGEGQRFPPSRRQNLNNTWATYSNWREGEFRGFLSPGLTPRIEPNFFQFVVDFWRDHVVPDELVITVDNRRTQDFVDAIHDNLLITLRRVVEHMVAYGVGVFDNRKYLVPEAVNPMYWLPVALPYDTGELLGTVIAVPYSISEFGMLDRIRITKVDDGIIYTDSHLYSGLSIGARDSSVPREEFPAQDYIFVPVSLDHTLFGRSEFRDIITYVKELSRRESSISESMDRRADPHLALGASSVTVDEDGNPVVDLRGMVIPVNPDEPTPEYITNDINYVDEEEAISRCITRLWWASGISPSLLDSNSKLSSNVPMSGAALRRLANVTTHKIRGYWEVLTPAIENTLKSQILLSNITPGVESIPMFNEIEIDFGMPLVIRGEEDVNNGEERVPGEARSDSASQGFNTSDQS